MADVTWDELAVRGAWRDVQERDAPVVTRIGIWHDRAQWRADESFDGWPSGQVIVSESLDTVIDEANARLEEIDGVIIGGSAGGAFTAAELGIRSGVLPEIAPQSLVDTIFTP